MFLKARLLFQKSRFPCAICKKYQKKLHFFQFFLVFYQFFRYFCYKTKFGNFLYSQIRHRLNCKNIRLSKPTHR